MNVLFFVFCSNRRQSVGLFNRLLHPFCMVGESLKEKRVGGESSDPSIILFCLLFQYLLAVYNIDVAGFHFCYSASAQVVDNLLGLLVYNRLDTCNSSK